MSGDFGGQELTVYQPDGQDLAERVAQLELRIAQLEDQLAALSGAGPAAQSKAASTPSRLEESGKPAGPPPQISPGLLDVIKLLQQGRSAEAQERLRGLGAEELAEQRFGVALVAAVLCIERDDFASALKALQKARQLTDDDRLLSIVSKLEARIG